MSTRQRLTVLRSIILLALAVSAVLAIDHLRPGRAFCPLEEACEAARSSPMGQIGGVPTSVLGMVAFAAFFGMTFLRPGVVRKALLVPGSLAGACGVWLIVYQGLILQSWCPLCLVVDGLAIVAGLLTLTWAPPPWGQGGWPNYEATSARVAWCLGAVLAVVAPLAWPRDVDEAWQMIPPLADEELLFEELPPTHLLSEDEPEEAEGHVEDAAPAPSREETPPLDEPRVLASSVPGESVPSSAQSIPVASDPVAAPTSPSVALAPEGLAVFDRHAPEESEALVAVAEAPEPATHPAPVTPEVARPAPVAPETPVALASAAEEAPTDTRPRIRMVEYLNAFCTHCRATYRTLERVLHELEPTVSVQSRRVYTWSGNETPLWVRACLHMRDMGRRDLELRLFEELMRAKEDTPAELFAAARRAGVPMTPLREALRVGEPTMRLIREQRLMRRARLKGLPTIDIGQRRLMGEQREVDLRRAIDAALGDTRE